MAIDTLRALRALVGIVVLVAGKTVGNEFDFEDRFDVTGDTLRFRMCAMQSVVGVDVMVEAQIGPTAAGMTGIAGLATMPIVIVIFEVAGDTGHVEFIGKRVLAVAAVTALLGMFAIDHEVGITIVIETCVVPTVRVMTVAALIAAAAVVRVIFRVAVVTHGRRVLKGIVCMAVQAAWLLVFADQGVFGRTVIEFHVEPPGRGMAVAANRAQCLPVWIIFLMAGITVAWRLTMLVIGGMTVRACFLGVFAEQWKVRELVIETRLVEPYDVGITALVVRMAAGTAVLHGIREFAVKACRIVDIARDIFMAVEAKRALLAAFESLMAGVTFLFVLSMALDDLARHDQRFDLGICWFGSDNC